jgi:hypothetical protein
VKGNLRGITLCISLGDAGDSTDDRCQYNPSLGQVLNSAPSRYVAEFSSLTAIFDPAMLIEGTKPKYSMQDGHIQIQ